MSADDGTRDHLLGRDARHGRLVALLSAAAAGEPGDGLSRIGRVCALSVSEVGVSGAGVTVMARLAGGLEGRRDQMWATDDVARRLETLQLTAGEGPCLDAYAAGAPVLVADLGRDSARWLGFAPEAVAAGAAAVFSLPLQVGAVRLGTLDLHRVTVGALSRDQLTTAVVLAGLATEIVLQLLDPDSHDRGQDTDAGVAAGEDAAGMAGTAMGWLPGVHAEVHQASGMVSGREGIGVDQALLRIRAHAFAHNEPIEQVARRILDRDLVLDRVDGTRDDDRDDGPASPDVERDR